MGHAVKTEEAAAKEMVINWGPRRLMDTHPHFEAREKDREGALIRWTACLRDGF